ncbi:hypothetical protein ACFYO9_04920 [Streptomyces sp. NPDC005863]|uniref:hypothetical protein n=1 Tax=unclassified Streptomyces TaxID=2593676 RepID=UPI0033E4F62B
MEKIRLPHWGLGNGKIPVSHAPSGLATVVEMKSGVLSSLYVYGVIDTPEQLEKGDMLLTHNTGSRHRARALVPREYTHLAVDKSKVGSFPRWRLGFRSSDSLSTLKKNAEGRHPDVLQYTGGRGTAKLDVGDGYVYIKHRSPGGEVETELHRSSGPFRGTFQLPGPGLIVVNCLVRWSVTLR